MYRLKQWSRPPRSTIRKICGKSYIPHFLHIYNQQIIHCLFLQWDKPKRVARQGEDQEADEDRQDNVHEADFPGWAGR